MNLKYLNTCFLQIDSSSQFLPLVEIGVVSLPKDALQVFKLNAIERRPLSPPVPASTVAETPKLISYMYLALRGFYTALVSNYGNSYISASRCTTVIRQMIRSII